jgi:hypothetical protein
MTEMDHLESLGILKKVKLGLKPIDMEVCYWALLFMLLVILHHLLNVFVQLANKRGFKQKQKTIFLMTCFAVFQLFPE